MPAVARKLTHSTTTSPALSRRPRGSVALPIPDAWDWFITGYELAAEANGITARSIANRRSSVRWLARYLRDEHGITDPEDVTKSHMQAAMAEVHKTRARSGARTFYNDCKAVLDWWAADTGGTSPLTGIKRPSDVISPVKVLTEHEVSAILAATSGRDLASVRDNAVVMLLLESGMRRAELCQLDIQDVDVRAREAVIRRGKGGRSRVVVFGASTASALHRWMRMHPCRDEPGSQPLFTTTAGKRMAECSIGEMLTRRGDQAGVPGLRAHVFRHSWAHYSMAAGVQEHDIQHLGGWTTTTQLGRYGAAMAVVRAKAAGKSNPVLKLIKGG